MTGNFSTIVVCDFEYEIADGDLPDVLCMVAYVLDERLNHVRTARLWRGGFGPSPPFDTGPDTLFVAYSAWADLTCFMTLSWKFPVHVFDLHTAYLSVSNVLLPHNPDEVRKRERKGLSDACRAYDIEGWEDIDKPNIARDIGEGRWQLYGRERVFGYCEEDVRVTAALLEKMLIGRARFKPADVARILHWSDYIAKAVARIQSRGMPIDMRLWDAVQENKAAVIAHLLRTFDPSHDSDFPIYTPKGEWSYTRFEAWLASTGVTAWPRLSSGALDTDSDAFRLMYTCRGCKSCTPCAIALVSLCALGFR